MRQWLPILAWLCVAAAAFAANAESLNYKSLRTEGYGEVASTLERMTPEQRKAVLAEAAKLQGDLQRLSPEERRRLTVEMDRVYLNTDFSNVDTNGYTPKRDRLGSLPQVRQQLRHVGQ